MNKKILYGIGLFLLILHFGCGENDPEETGPVQELNFISLEAEKDTLFSGDTTLIKAIATGSDLEFLWSATKGDLLGSGSEVIYASSRCHVGTNQVTCEVIDKNDQSETKTIDIVVIE
ncbi:MAG: hypothetical protein JXR31_05065 [Prolixibacteraceae bacterium]|nr:hypothetical protein [Prolixibacteraceae bacterium]MBN2773596.1 hypothetical protein [Prolixibacteraceae bacterium]